MRFTAVSPHARVARPRLALLLALVGLALAAAAGCAGPPAAMASRNAPESA